MTLSQVLTPLPALLCAIAVALCPGCRRDAPEPWEIASFRVAQGEPQPGISDFSFDEPALLAELTRALAAIPRFTVLRRGQKPRAPGHSFLCRLEIALARELPSEVVSRALDVEVGVSVELWREGGLPRLTADGVGRATFSPPEGDGATATDAARQKAFGQALGRALREALAAQKLQLEALEKSTSQLIADLGAEDLRRRDFAIRALAERRAPEALEPLLAHLSEDEDPSLVLRAAGALGSLGDARATPALIDAAERLSLPEKAALLSIIGFLGGPDAEGYLFTLSTGHPAEDVRRIAQLQLDALASRADRAGAGVGAAGGGKAAAVEVPTDDGLEGP